MTDELKDLDFRIDKGKFGFWYDLDKLIPFQGKLVGMKDKKADKLGKSLKKYMIDPFMVWQAPDENVYILDGHQRRKKLLENGFAGQVPCVGVRCKSEREAKEMILAFRSQYGEILEREHLYEFIEENNLDWANDLKYYTDFTEINIGTFDQEFYQDNPPDLPKDKKKTTCPECGCEF